MNQSLKDQYQRLLLLIFGLQAEFWPFKEIDKNTAFAEVVKFAQILGIGLEPTDPNFLPRVAEEVIRHLTEVETTAPDIPPNLDELVKIYEEHLQEIQENNLKLAFPSLDEQIKALYERYRQIVLKEFQQTKTLAENPKLAQAISQQVTFKTISQFPQVATQQAFEETTSPQDYQETVEKSLRENLVKIGIKNPQVSASEKIAQDSFSLAKALAATPHNLPPPAKLPPVSEEIPPKISAKIAVEEEGVAFTPVFTAFHPPTLISFSKKVVLSPLVKPLQWAIKTSEKVPLEIKSAINKGLTSADIDQSIKVLENAGLPPNHPRIDQLKNQKEKLAEFESAHQILSFVLRHYHQFSKKTGRREIQEPLTGLFLPKLQPPPAWDQQKGYSWFFRQGLNRVGLFFRTHQWLPSESGRKVVRFVLPDKIIRLITFGRIESFATLKTAAYKKIVQPVLVWLGKTTIGKVIKAGAKKLITWGLTKLGLAAIPEPLVSKALLVLSLLKDAASLLKRGLKRLLEKPELAILGGIFLIGLPILLPMLPALGLIFTVAGIISAGIGLLGKATSLIAGIAGKIGGFLSGAANTAAGFFSSLSTISLPSSLPAVVVGGSLGITAIATTMTVMTVGGAFVQEGKGEPIPHLGTSVAARPPGEAGHLAETVIWTLNQCGITAVNKSTWSSTETCLQASSLPNKEAIISQFRFSVFDVGPGLQCVGFVRGIMAALGKDPGGGRHANGYLNLPTPPGYQPVNRNMKMVQIGDLVIIKGGSYGHIAIVVEKKENLIKVAQAWGTGRGLLEITEVNPAYFDGFLRPE